RCASASEKTAASAAGSVSDDPSRRATPAKPHMGNEERRLGTERGKPGNLEESLLDRDDVARLDLVGELQIHFHCLAVDRAAGFHAAVGSAIGEAAGERNRLFDGETRLDHERAGIAHVALYIKGLRLGHEDDVAVLQGDVAGAARLQIPPVDANDIGVL